MSEEYGAVVPSDLQSFLSSEQGILLFTGVLLGALTTLLVILLSSNWWLVRIAALSQAQDTRHRLPRTIILVRHGESAANADNTLWKTTPDNLLGLTDKGKEQAELAGHRIEAILKQDKRFCARVHLVVSPFERTLQTAAALRPAIEHRIVRTDIESRIREQEVGNLQSEEFDRFRQEQKRVGRFWYRFNTGESGADVLDRVKSWWFESVLTVNLRVGYEPVDAMVVVTHGLTMRFILMQLFGWSPTTFHSVWNAPNCGVYVLRKDLTKPGTSPYILDTQNGDLPRSSIDIRVEFKSTGKSRTFKLEQYLSIPPPRTRQIELVKQMLEHQYPSEVQVENVASISFLLFIEGGRDRTYKESTSGVEMSSQTLAEQKATTEHSHQLLSDRLISRLTGLEPFQRADVEQSLRFPCIQVPEKVTANR